MGSITHIVIRLSGLQDSFDDILNIIGMGMLIPMPVLWLFDWATIALGWYGLVVQAASHSLVQIWEAGIETLGFRRILGLKVSAAVALAITINAVYILLAMVFIR